MAGSEYRIGFAKELINPERGISLAGYFDPRYNKGVLDDIFVKVALFEQGGTIAGFVSVDLVYFTAPLYDAAMQALQKANVSFAENLILTATHTHTAPDVRLGMTGGGDEEYEEKVDNYMVMVADKIVAAVKRAEKNLTESELLLASAKNNNEVFVRRFYMKNGKVVTNPGKLNPDIVRPESEPDREVNVFVVRQYGREAFVMCNLCNHCDTTEGDYVSADWPGHLEKYIQEKIGWQIPVITLVGPSGNLNHFDVTSNMPQSSYEESRRIGRAYGWNVWQLMQKAEVVKPGNLQLKNQTVSIPHRTLTKEELDNAREVMAATADLGENTGAALTSEDLAKGSPLALRFFAQQYLEFDENTRGIEKSLRFTAIRMGNEIGFASLPGEPFTEIGMAIKEKSELQKTVVVAYSNGSFGYVPLKECFPRGGYETMPRVNGGICFEGAEIFENTAVKLLNG